MARKRASLQGRGNEILMGAHPDEQAETVVASESQALSGVDESQTASVLGDEIQDHGDDGQELSPEWADLLQEEALSASGSETSVLDSELAANLDLSLPPLATTPARPNRPTDETPAAASSPEDESAPEVGASDPEPTIEFVESVEAPEDNGSVAVANAGHAIEAAPEAAVVTSSTAIESVAYDEPTPPAPYSEDLESVAAGGAYVPAPKEKPEATDSVLRAKLDGLLYQQATVKPSDKDLEPDGPDAPEMVIEEIEDYEIGQPSRSRREPEILATVGRAQRTALWNETLELYEAVPEILAGDTNQGRALRLLQEAQDILLEKPRQYDVARFKVGQVQTLVSWRRNVNKWSSTYGWGIFVYEVLWIVALVSGVFAAELIAELVTSLSGGVPGIDGLSRLWSTMMWGGLGGVIGAFYSLYWHVAKVRDFDKQYTMWYIVQPVIGLLLGALMHLLIGSGFLTAQGTNQQNQTVTVSLFPYAVACIAGFRQRFILEIIDRVIQVITPSPPPAAKPAEETTIEEPLDSSE